MGRDRVIRGHGARIVAAAVLATGGLLATAGPVTAEPPARLDQQITDEAAALAGQEPQVAAALADLQSAQGIQLWVAYVEGFDGLSGQDWAAQTSSLSGLGGNDMLFAVATEERSYGWDVAGEIPVSDAEIEEIMAREVEPELSDGDWAGATLALAAGLADTDADAGSDGSSGSSVWPWILGAVVLAGAGLLVASLVRRGRRGSGSGGPGSRPGSPGADGSAGHPAEAPAPAPIEDLRKHAAASLIEADDSIRTSEQELGFAIAQFGDQSAAPFTAALAQSTQELASAFGLQRAAQAATDEAAERASLEQIISLCRSADGRLDEQVEAFDALRDLERTIDTVLPGLGDRVTRLQSRLVASVATTEQLKATWPPAALGNLVRNLDQAVDRVKFAEESVASGTALLAGADRVGAVAHARAAEESIAQATTLLDNVDRAPETLDLAQRAIAALEAETQKDITEAESLGLPVEVASPHRFAADTLSWARTAVASGNYDPIAVRRALEESDTALENALAPARAAAETRRRAEALLATATDAARASIQAADDFITTRRGAVGADARTRLAEAQRRFAAGQSAEDPVVALEHMQAADHLSDQANSLAQQDEANYRNSQQMSGGSSSGGLSNVILGGILINAMTQGASGLGGAGRGGGVKLPGRGAGPGSFGGGATRGRRSGGGRF